MAKKTAGPAGTFRWTGDNLADAKHFHRDVAHYPEDVKAAPVYRDESQHPDVLHVNTDDGHTLLVRPGDTLHRNARGQLSVERPDTPPAPRALRSVPPTRGRVIDAEAGAPDVEQLRRENERLRRQLSKAKGGAE